MSDRWPPERVSALVRMWDAGTTASQIAAELGVTRDAVLDMVRRRALVKHKGGRPVATGGKRATKFKRSFNLFLTYAHIDWLDQKFGYSKRSAGIRALIDEAMAGKAKPVEQPKPRVVYVERRLPESSIPWPTRDQLMGRRA